MKKTISILLCIVALTLTGCVGYGNLSHNAMNQTEVILQSNNYNVIKNVEGTTRSTYVLGIGGFTQKTMKENAVNEMFKNANLKNGQAIVNISYTTSAKTILGVYMEKRVTAYGTVIEFVK